MLKGIKLEGIINQKLLSRIILLSLTEKTSMTNPRILIKTKQRNEKVNNRTR